MKETAKTIAGALLEIGAVFLRPNEPFTWASGIKSPIYCDNRLILAHPQQRQLVEDALAKIVKEQFPTTELIMGTATAGIAHAALVAERLGLPMGYVRASHKDHGRNNKIEGQDPKGLRVLLIEDLVSTGGSSMAAVEALREAGAELCGLLSIFTYGMQKSKDLFAKQQLPYQSLSNIDALLELAEEQGKISAQERKAIIMFREEPANPQWMSALQS